MLIAEYLMRYVFFEDSKHLARAKWYLPYCDIVDGILVTVRHYIIGVGRTFRTSKPRAKITKLATLKYIRVYYGQQQTISAEER